MKSLISRFGLRAIFLAFLICAVGVRVYGWCQRPQAEPVKGFWFTWNEADEITDARYYGSCGLRAARLHCTPTLSSLTVEYGTSLTSDDVKYIGTIRQLKELDIGPDTIVTPMVGPAKFLHDDFPL